MWRRRSSLHSCHGTYAFFLHPSSNRYHVEPSPYHEHQSNINRYRAGLLSSANSHPSSIDRLRLNSHLGRKPGRKKPWYESGAYICRFGKWAEPMEGRRPSLP
ncbi:hypothetical protein Y032_0005g2410 [Ancylostoma ceylanicum]|uniref:Uncharacterized protein n=1 Tax=Ancylostoma ceylanicum TaxID=53326 RepID=A0A016VRP0_9BILA|nr:hypothetical protein Y032_0005g2410 [Ancylostoma ceylanicum]